MDTYQIVPIQEGLIEHSTHPYTLVIDMVLNAVGERTRVEYRRALNDFMTWYVSTGQKGLNKAVVAAHMTYLEHQGVPPSSRNQRLSAIRKLVAEAADNELISEGTAQAINRVQPIKLHGKKMGNWLTIEQARAMLAAPDTSTLKGARDHAVLAVMLGCGLRREEVVMLEVAHLQQRENRWVILDLTSKHHRTRTVPMAGWVYDAVKLWLDLANITEGPVFRRIFKASIKVGDGLTDGAVWGIIKTYSPVPNLAPHDLRRTYAKLAMKGGAELAQISLTLGHASMRTTELYLGNSLDLEHAPSDYIDM